MPGIRLWICISLVVILNACGDEHFISARGLLDWDYFPLKEGDAFLYEYSKITYLGKNITPDSEAYLIKEEVINVDYNADGSSLFTMLTSKRLDQEPWQPLFYWTIRIEYDKAISLINNLEYVELQLPLLERNHWEGQPEGTSCRDNNGFCDVYEVKDIDKDFKSGSYTFNHTVKVIKQNQTDPLQITGDLVEFSVYAQNIGRVYWELKNIEYASCRNNQNPECCCADQILCTLCAGQIEFGSIEKKVLRERISQ